jgi:hypothetical protein
VRIFLIQAALYLAFVPFVVSCAALPIRQPASVAREHLTGEALVADTYRRIQSLVDAKLPFVTVKELGLADGKMLHWIEVRSPNPDATRVFLTSGVHGNEGEAVTTGMELLGEAIGSETFRQHFALTYVPMVNPAGLARSIRRNLQNEDINRTFMSLRFSEAAKLIAAQPNLGEFHVAIDLHGAARKTQFFLIRNQEDNGLTERALAGVPRELLLPSTSGKYPDYAPGLNEPQKYMIFSPGNAVSTNEGTVKSYLAARGVPLTYTLEYPGLISFESQQDWNGYILRSILKRVQESRSK